MASDSKVSIMQTLTPDILRLVIDYLPSSIALELADLPIIGDYAFQHIYQDVEITDSMHTGCCGPSTLEYDDLIESEPLTYQLSTYQTARYTWSRRPSDFSNVYAYRRFLDKFKHRLVPRTISFELINDLYVIHASHPDVLSAAKSIQVSEEENYDHEGNPQDFGAYIERINKVLSLPYNFTYLYLENLHSPDRSWFAKTFTFPKSLRELQLSIPSDISPEGELTANLDFLESLKNLELTSLSVFLNLSHNILQNYLPLTLRVLLVSKFELSGDFRLSGLENLHDLILGDTAKDPDATLDLSNLRKTRVVVLRSFGIRSLEQIQFPPNMKKLSLCNFNRIESIEHLKSYKELTYLNILGCFSVKSMVFPTTLKRLELKYYGSFLTDDEVFRVKLDETTVLPPHLTYLEVSGHEGFEVCEGLKLPPTLLDFYLDSCMCTKLPQLPDSIEYLRIKSDDLTSIDDVKWPSLTVSLSFTSSNVDNFPFDSLLDLKNLQSCFLRLDSHDDSYASVISALQNPNFLAYLLLSDLAKRRKQSTENSSQESSARQHILKTTMAASQSHQVECEDLPSLASLSLKSSGLLSFTTLMLWGFRFEFKNGTLHKFSCPQLDESPILPSGVYATTMMIRGKVVTLPENLKEFSVHYSGEPTPLDGLLPDSLTFLLIYAPGEFSWPSLAFDLPNLTSINIHMHVGEISLNGCPNLVNISLNNCKMEILNLDSLPIWLKSLRIINAGMKDITGTLQRFLHLESLDFTSNELGEYFAKNKVILPDSLIIIDLTQNNLTTLAGIQVGTSTDVVTLIENEDLDWQSISSVCSQVEKRMGIVYAHLKGFFPDFIDEVLGENGNANPIQVEEVGDDQNTEVDNLTIETSGEMSVFLEDDLRDFIPLTNESTNGNLNSRSDRQAHEISQTRPSDQERIDRLQSFISNNILRIIE